MRASPIVEVEVSADRRLGMADGPISPEMDLLVSDRLPHPLDEDIVASGAFSVMMILMSLASRIFVSRCW